MEKESEVIPGSDRSDYDDDEDSQPIAELRASLYNLYNLDLFTPLPDKAHKAVASYLPLADIRNSRLVSRTWNSILVKYITFFVQLSDLTRYTFLDMPSPEKLIVSTILVRNLTKTILNPLNPVEVLMNFRMRSPKDVKKLIFRDGVKEECKSKILEAYHHFIEELNFLRIPFPLLPKEVQFSNCKSLEITTKNFSPGEETKLFFHSTTVRNFPVLQNLKIEFYTRDDILLYLGAHFFAASHYRTLRRLTLNFGYYLTDVEKFSKEEISSKQSSLSRSKIIERNGKLKDTLKKEAQYRKFLSMLPLMKVETLNLSLSLNEGTIPWDLSLRLIDAQRHLTTLKVEYPFVLKTKHFNFRHVIGNNSPTLRKISIPCLNDFDCTILTSCRQLESFSIGKEFSFNYLFFGSRGSLTNFPKFPALSTVQSISICVPLTKVEIRWLSSAIPANSLLVYGVETSEDYFACCEVMEVIHERPKLKKIMMRIYMDDDENNKLSQFLEVAEDIYTTDYFHAEDCGFTTFVIEAFSMTSLSPGGTRPNNSTSTVAYSQNSFVKGETGQ